mmetsp:Transcript_13872/g.40576  ORF Transcript_13872/g.40576 Transcript_13872/m.40576 type:complete len:384 (+) Transcript_13872:261-1412(+)
MKPTQSQKCPHSYSFSLIKHATFHFAKSWEHFLAVRAEDDLARFIVEKMSADDSCIINHLFLPHPPCIRLLNEDINSFTGTLSLQCHLNRLRIGDKLPQPISCYNHKLIFTGIEITLSEFRIRNHTCCVCYCVSEGSGQIKMEVSQELPFSSDSFKHNTEKRQHFHIGCKSSQKYLPRHGKPGNVHVAKPHARWAINTIVIFNGKNSTSCSEDTLLFFWGIRLVVVSELISNNFTMVLSGDNDTGVANVHPCNSVSPNNGHRECCATEFSINAKVSDNLVLHLGNCISRGLLHIRGPTRVRNHLGCELVAEVRGNTVTMLTMSIEATEDQCIRSRIVSHNERVLVLLPWVVGGVPFFGHSRIFSDSTADRSMVLRLLVSRGWL